MTLEARHRQLQSQLAMWRRRWISWTATQHNQQQGMQISERYAAARRDFFAFEIRHADFYRKKSL